ncbi:hypothetical protein Tco_0347515 [Tanacetum coccineum]
MAQQPIRCEEELCPSDKRVAVNINNMRLDPDEIHVEPLFNLTLAILKQHSIINASGAPTLGRGQGKGYMRKGGLEVPREGLGAALDSPDHSDSFDNSIWDSSNDDKTKSVKDSDYGDDTNDYDKDSDAEEDQTTGFGILVHDKEPEQPQLELQPHSPITLTLAPLLASIPEVKEQANVDHIMDSLPTSTTTITPPTKLKKNQAKKLLKKINHAEAIEDSVKANMPKFVPKSVSDYVQPRLEKTILYVIKKNLINLFQSSSTPSIGPIEYELKHQLYEKLFEKIAYLTHDKHHALYDALQESLQIDELQA